MNIKFSFLVISVVFVLVCSKPQHEKYTTHEETILNSRKTRQVSTPPTSTSTSTRIPPANPEITTVYKVPCACPFTPQYDPVCGSDGQNYGNLQILNCAQFCGSNVTLVYRNACGSNRG